MACRNLRLAAWRAHARPSSVCGSARLWTATRSASTLFTRSATATSPTGAQDKIAREAALDSLFVNRTSLAAGQLSATDGVHSCKTPTHVERAFRTLEATDLQVRPIHY